MEKSQSLVVLLCIFLFTVTVSATQFKVGGSNGWTLPQPNTVSYNQWAQRNRFQIGDSLLFTYKQGEDSVLLVSQDAYNNCDTSSPIKKFDDGNTIFTFDRSGLFFFISGVQANCLKKESLVVLVMANRTGRSSNKPSLSPPASPPSGSSASPPALSPYGSSTSPPTTSPSVSAPSPAGTGEGPSSPGTGETGPSADNNSNPNPNPSVPSSPEVEGSASNPSSSPSGDGSSDNNNTTTPSNGASLKVVGAFGPLLALVAMFVM